MAVVGALLATTRSARALTVVAVRLLVLLAVLPSVVPVVLTTALLDRTVPSVVPAGTVTWTVKTVVPPLARVTLREQVTAWPVAEQSTLEPLVLNSVPVGRVSVTVIRPRWVEGPLLVTVRV